MLSKEKIIRGLNQQDNRIENREIRNMWKKRRRKLCHKNLKNGTFLANHLLRKILNQMFSKISKEDRTEITNSRTKEGIKGQDKAVLKEINSLRLKMRMQ